MLHIISWNISYSGDIKQKIKLLKSIVSEISNEGSILITLQEVTDFTYQEITKDDLFINHHYSLHFREPGRYDGNNRKLGCLTCVIGNIKLMDSTLLFRAPFPERTLLSTLSYNNSTFNLLNFHSLTGVDYKKTKSAQFSSKQNIFT